jgi:hypothetical protein
LTETFNTENVAGYSNINDVDKAFFDWWKNKLNLSLQNKNGVKIQVPIVFFGAERWQSARRDDVRDANGTIVVPLIAIGRSGENTENDAPTSRIFADTKDDVVYHKEVDPKSSFLKEEIRKQKENGVAVDPNVPIYQIYTRQAPDWFNFTYQVKIWVAYASQINEFLQKFGQSLDWKSVRCFNFYTDNGYRYTAFQENEIEDESNFDDFSESERIIKRTLTFKVNAYLHPENDDKKPTFKKYFTQSKVVIKISDKK